jgi:hypothetical protein
MAHALDTVRDVLQYAFEIAARTFPLSREKVQAFAARSSPGQQPI